MPSDILPPNRRVPTGHPLASTADRFAIGSSFACLAHCLLLPLAIAFVPALGRVAGATEGLHLLIFIVAVPISALAMIAGYWRHGLLVPAAMAGVGLLLLGVGAVGSLRLAMELSVTVAGSLLLAIAHFANLRANRRPG